jgi:hypothetical protein
MLFHLGSACKTKAATMSAQRRRQIARPEVCLLSVRLSVQFPPNMAEVRMYVSPLGGLYQFVIAHRGRCGRGLRTLSTLQRGWLC